MDQWTNGMDQAMSDRRCEAMFWRGETAMQHKALFRYEKEYTKDTIGIEVSLVFSDYVSNLRSQAWTNRRRERFSSLDLMSMFIA